MDTANNQNWKRGLRMRQWFCTLHTFSSGIPSNVSDTTTTLKCFSESVYRQWNIMTWSLEWLDMSVTCNKVGSVYVNNVYWHSLPKVKFKRPKEESSMRATCTVYLKVSTPEQHENHHLTPKCEGCRRESWMKNLIYAPRLRTNVHRYAQLAICKKIKLLSAANQELYTHAPRSILHW